MKLEMNKKFYISRKIKYFNLKKTLLRGLIFVETYKSRNVFILFNYNKMSKNNDLISLIAQREENKRLYIKPLSKKITALKKLIEQNKRRKKTNYF